MKYHIFNEEQMVEIMMRIMDVQDMIMAQELDPDLYDILEEALELLDPEE